MFDILVFGTSLQEHLPNLKLIFQALDNTSGQMRLSEERNEIFGRYSPKSQIPNKKDKILPRNDWILYKIYKRLCKNCIPNDKTQPINTYDPSLNIL